VPQMLIGGEQRAAAAELEVLNPATEEVVDTVPAGSAEDVNSAVEAAKRAFPEWSKTDVEKRAALLGAAADLVQENAKELAGLLTAEQGKPFAEAMGEVTHLVHGMHYYAEAATKVRGVHQELPSAFGPAYGMVIRRPLGVAAAITPYNFPLTLLGTKVAPALAMGNTVVAKPAATTPLATLRVAELFAEAGVPDGVVNVVTGRGSEIGDVLVSHPDVRRVAFTGSTEVGRRVVRLAGPDFKRVTLELGGSDPVIVCDDADVEAAVKAVIIGRYWNAGQACLGCKRVYVHDSVYDDFVSQLVERVGRYEPGDGTVKAEKPKLRMGPIHTRQGRDELLEQIEDGGGEVLIAPADSHLGVTTRGTVALSASQPIGSHRPSATHLFRTVAEAFGDGALGVMLTGMGDDGVAGLRALKAARGLVFAQDEATSVLYGMPREAVAQGVVDSVLPLDRMAGSIAAACTGRRPR